MIVFGLSSSTAELKKDTKTLENAQNLNMFVSFYNVNETWVFIMNCIHVIANDIVLFIFYFLVDILLVVQVRKDLSKKKKIILKETAKHVKIKKLQDIQKTHDDTNKMVVFNLFLFFLCRLPEFFFHLQLVILRDTDSDSEAYSTICISNNLCGLMLDMTQFMYMFTYCMNIVFYYKYNRNFRFAFRSLFRLSEGGGGKKLRLVLQRPLKS